ncbi:hypothetical protein YASMINEVIRUS_780 [Yasminevirus sp. GU-2018]|uniref:Apple domain-containing protein n=1 Tax=Yasminevirus sp. GU-2018 TaxID=2420051 RepID=A0A5K0U8U1_9VIRU|nr:hypothetical protein YASMINEVIRUS_780 [Yasminevirus sp. GU-2018]
MKFGEILLILIVAILLLYTIHEITSKQSVCADKLPTVNVDDESDTVGKKKEHYDLEISDVTAVECGTKCTEGLNCAGFGYKPVEAKCYLSKSAILGRPMESLYSDSYSKLDRRCNKINRITDDKRIDGNTLTANSVYICSDGENNTATEFQYANLGGSALESARTTIFDRADSDIVTPTNVKYDVYEITWPKTKPASSQTEGPVPLVGPKDKLLASDQSSNVFGFIESDKEFLGQYVLAHQCVSNTPLFDCLKYCENNPNCAGTEWNRALVKKSDDGKYDYLYENVCCPKSVIKQIIPRRDKLDRGRFYVKKPLKEMISRDKVVVSKAEFNDVPTNNRFALKITEIDKSEFNSDATNQNVKFVEGNLDDLPTY